LVVVGVAHRTIKDRRVKDIRDIVNDRVV
jgi:hypothetical protein